MSIEITEVGTTLDDIACPNCAAVVWDATAAREGHEWTPACVHVFLLAHDVAITYLRPDARTTLQESGVDLDGPDDAIDISDDCHESRWDILDAHLPLDGARILAVYAPAPVFDGFYIGIADA